MANKRNIQFSVCKQTEWELRKPRNTHKDRSDPKEGQK